MASNLKSLADDMAQAAADVRWAQDWRDVGDMLARFEQRARDAFTAWTAVVAERDRLRTERDRLRAQLEEREADMHARIRASYDATVADCWRAAIAKVEAERDRLRAELDILSGGES